MFTEIIFWFNLIESKTLVNLYKTNIFYSFFNKQNTKIVNDVAFLKLFMFPSES